MFFTCIKIIKCISSYLHAYESKVVMGELIVCALTNGQRFWSSSRLNLHYGRYFTEIDIYFFAFCVYRWCFVEIWASNFFSLTSAKSITYNLLLHSTDSGIYLNLHNATSDGKWRVFARHTMIYSYSVQKWRRNEYWKFK